MSLPKPFLPSKKHHSKLSFNRITEARCLTKHWEIQARHFSFNLQIVMSPKKAAARISMPMTKYCTRDGEFSGVTPASQPWEIQMCVKGKMSQVMLKVNMPHPLLASIQFSKQIPYSAFVLQQIERRRSTCFHRFTSLALLHPQILQPKL